MPDPHDATTGDKRKPDDAAQSRPEKAQKVDHPLAPEADLDFNDKNTSQHGTAVEPHGREMLEKGIIYFFLRVRVGTKHTYKVSDIERTFILLRPLPTDAKLDDGPTGVAGNSSLISIPEKEPPKTGRDRWIASVDKTNASFDDLKNDFYPANDDETRTAGVRDSPSIFPVGKGVYALTTTGRESHLAYMIARPYDLGDLQTTIGLKKQGSWILSTRNPRHPAPSKTGLPEGPQYSQEILNEFHSMRWVGTVPKHLVLNAQCLLVGELSGIQKAMEPDEENKDDKDTNESVEEMEELQHQDVKRMEHLDKTDSDAIFLYLETFAKDLPQLHNDF